MEIEGIPLLNCGSTDGKAELLKALKDNDINEFRQILYQNKDVIDQTWDKNNYRSIFETACQTPGRYEFVLECIDFGCDVNKINEHLQKAPINFAVESLDYDNIATIACEPIANLDNAYNQETPLNCLARELKNSNFINVFACIKLLIERRVNPNIPNRKGITPIITVLTNKEINNDQKEEVVKYLLENAHEIDLDNFRKGQARVLLEEHFPNLELPPASERIPWSFSSLLRAVRNEPESVFLRGLNELYLELQHDSAAIEKLFSEHDEDDTLLSAAARRGYAASVERLIRLRASPNKKIRNNLTAIEAACQYGHYKVLEILLKVPKIELRTEEPLLIIVVKRIGQEPTDKSDYNKCFDLLIDHPRTDINAKGIHGHSALHYAINYSNQLLVLKLLERGAYMGVINNFDRPAIHDISPIVLETHLHTCIDTNNAPNGTQGFEIIFNYKNLVPDCYTHRKDTEQLNITEFKNEMAPINYIANTKELKHLLLHPIIQSFIFLKWQRLACIFYFNFILYAIFCVSMVSYILFCYRETGDPCQYRSLLYWISLLFIILLLIRELFQVFMAPLSYIKSAGNYIEIALVIVVLYILFEADSTIDSTKRTLSGIAIILIIWESVLLVGSLPILSLSTHLVMLKTVSLSFIKSFMLYSFILFGFALCFFTLLHEEGNANAPKANGNATDSDDGDDFNKFNNIFTSILKTLVMLTGEFEAANINFDLNATSYFVFVLFLFLVSTVLLNLLSGLAVSDTQAIRSEATLTDIVQRAEVMGRYESILLVPSENCIKAYVMRWVSNKISLFVGYLEMNKMSVLPNVKNQIKRRIHIENTSAYNGKRYDLELGGQENLFGTEKPWWKVLDCCDSTIQMDRSIVKEAMKVISQKKTSKIEEEKRNELSERIRNIENSISNIFQKINSISQNMQYQNQPHF